MIKNYFLIALRSIAKNKLFIFINVFGMGIAVACCIVGYFAFEYDRTFDANHKNGATIYRVDAMREFNGKMTRTTFSPMPLASVVKTIKDVDKSSRFYFSWSNFKREDDLFEAKLSYVDPDFFDMFTFDFIVGDARGIRDLSSVLINDNMAERLFGSAEKALGKTIGQTYQGKVKEVKITGVFKSQPQNSSFFPREAYANFENCNDEHPSVSEDDWRVDNTLFVQINDPSRVEAVKKQLQPFTANSNKVREDLVLKEFLLDPFLQIGHIDREEDLRNWTWNAPPFSAIIGSAIMGVLILLISCFNLTNTAIAISSRRLKEIGIRKVMGSIRSQLIIQFISETMLICLLGLLVGLFLGEFLVEGWNDMWEYMHLTPHYFDNSKFIFFMVGVLIFTGLLAGSYPAFYISKFEPISILKGKAKFGGTNMFTRILLGLQFAISLIAIISAIAFIENARYQDKYDLGFDAKGTVIAWLNGREEFDSYRNALQGNGKIISMAGASSGIFSNRTHEPVKFESSQMEVDIINVGDNYLKTLNLTLVEGRDFRRDSETDKNESIIITQKMANEFGWDKSVGKQIIWHDTVKLYVVGVVKDVYTAGLWREMQPMMIRYVLPDQYTQIVVNTSAANAMEVDKFMEAKWKEVFQNKLYNGSMMITDLNEVYNVNKNIVTMYTFLGIVAMLLSATGLFTLVSLNIIKRTKEIGVRKVLGASIGNITRIINMEFFVILAVASVVGSYLSYYAVNGLMDSIWDYYQATTVLTFIISVTVMFGISAAVVGYKVYSAASMNPVSTLRDE